MCQTTHSIVKCINNGLLLSPGANFYLTLQGFVLSEPQNPFWNIQYFENLLGI